MRLLSLLILSSSVASFSLHSQTIAHSADDWNSALGDGIGASGIVTPGSLDDIAQQGHADFSGSGNWYYGFGNNLAGKSFSGGFPLFDIWINGAGWTRGGLGYNVVGVTGTSPAGNPPGADTVTYRRWESNGAHTGETLVATLTYTVGQFTTDGLTIGLIAEPLNQNVIVHDIDDRNQTFTTSLTFVDDPQAQIIAAVAPWGPNGLASNFFNDSVSMTLVISPLISVIPEPSSAMFFGAFIGTALLIRRRRA